MKKLFQVVAKWHYSNQIAVYNYSHQENFTEAVKELEKKEGVTLLATNIAYTL